ncbi:hypothetical protein HHK36_012702 [Tetracentron sinense]|uniref:Uncharacterized protein n=1 Tax=Tetracentron sinense TaxID=13715 RepID=A0A834Z9L4_TETSI|nr:hypothetical protein HHK36_012702 [Tetracentron sinense]
MGERPRLTEELEALRSSDEPTMARSGSELSEPEAEAETLRFLVDLFCQCTMGNPTDRPTAEHLYDILRARPNFVASNVGSCNILLAFFPWSQDPERISAKSDHREIFRQL